MNSKAKKSRAPSSKARLITREEIMIQVAWQADLCGWDRVRVIEEFQGRVRRLRRIRALAPIAVGEPVEQMPLFGSAP